MNYLRFIANKTSHCHAAIIGTVLYT